MIKLVNELLKTQSPAFASTVHQVGMKALPLIFVWLILIIQVSKLPNHLLRKVLPP